MFAFADTDGDGSLSFQEFEVAIIIEVVDGQSLKTLKDQQS